MRDFYNIINPMKRFVSILSSTRLTGVLFLLYAAAMAIATFIENDFGTQTAKALVYNAWWFELILLFFVINFIGNITKYKLYKREKWIVLLFHVAFIFIIVGAAITRYISYEGIMPIYEGETTNLMLSDKAFLEVQIDDGKDQKTPIYYEQLYANIPPESKKFTALAARFFNFLRGGNEFAIDTDFKGKPVSIEFVDYLPNAREVFMPAETGDTFINIVESGGGGRHEHRLKKGEVINMHGILFSFDNRVEGAYNIFYDRDTLKFLPPKEGTYMIMTTQQQIQVAADSVQNFQLRSLYSFPDVQFVVPEGPIKGSMVLERGDKDENQMDLLELLVKTDKAEQKVKIFGNALSINKPTAFSMDGLNFRLAYGSRQYQVPFQVKLRDFQLDRYPGSMSPKSYASEVTVIDKEKTFDFRIFMNNILDYKGFRFFQSSYNDQGEVEQTFLSVNHDRMGTYTTYFGYLLLFFALTFSLFSKKSRFAFLEEKMKKIKEKKKALTVLFFMLTLTGFAQEAHEHNDYYKTIDSLITTQVVDKEHAKKFGSLVIQDDGGRMKPVNTFASELLRKLSKKDTYESLDANQVLVSMVINPRAWYFVPFIYIKKENTKVRDLLGIPHDQKYARFSDLFTENGEYKLQADVAVAHKKKIKDKYEESILNIDERANLLYGALGGGIFKFFPLPGDPNHKWYSYPEMGEAGFKGNDSLYVKNILPFYGNALQKAFKDNNYTEADEYLDSMHQFQKKFGAEVMPSDRKVALEIFYNEYDIFKGLFWKYMLASLVLFVLVIVQIFNDKKLINILVKTASLVIIALFLYHTAGLVVRWYISGHAPWSNGYESMIFVAWATMFFGLVFGRNSALTVAASTFVTSMLLMIAHWNWMDPSIGNLVPVLDSYWLMVHVSIIVASYGPFTISMILGLLAMLLYIFTTSKNKPKLKLAIDEITAINEMSITIGLVMLVIGNFLGGMWANESWGRYWGWDPKETWALISIMIYAFVLHVRLIPGLRSKFTFNFLAVISFASILMTYLGVNHLLSGLHSYAAGESAPIPMEIWGWLTFSLVVSLLAFWKFKKYYKKIK